MVLNNFVSDFDSLLGSDKYPTRREVYEKLGVTRQALSCMLRRMNGKSVKKSYIELVDMIGYDVQIEYVPKTKNETERII